MKDVSRLGSEPGSRGDRGPSAGERLAGMNSGYYQRRLAGAALLRCYELAPPRVQQHLRAEVEFAVGWLRSSDIVLDLGCGYGRTLPDFATASRFAVGIDVSADSLALAARRLVDLGNILLIRMEASHLAFVDGSFDAVICVQNGIAAFGVDRRALVRETHRVLRPGGTAMFSSYSEQFWESRLEWFTAQADAGLIGPIDRERSGDGLIVCTDGLVLGAVGPEGFAELVDDLDAQIESTEVDGSCWFHLLRKGQVQSQ